MKYLFLLLLLLLPSLAFSQEGPKPRIISTEAFLNDPALPAIVKDFYNGKFKAANDAQTYRLLDTLTTRNDHFSAFYFTIFNEILKNPDSILAKSMGKYCFKIIYNYPYMFFYFLAHKGEYSAIYAKYLGGEFYHKKQGTSDLPMTYKEFHKYLGEKLNSKNKNIQKAFRDFDVAVRNSIKHPHQITTSPVH